MNDRLHTAATAAAFTVGTILILYAVALASLKLGDPQMALEIGLGFIAGSGLIQMVPQSVAIGRAIVPGDAVSDINSRIALQTQGLRRVTEGHYNGPGGSAAIVVALEGGNTTIQAQPDPS